MRNPDAVAALSALAQTTRLEIFRMLVREGEDGLPAGTISHRLRLAAPNLSFHLNHLSQARLVTSRRAGRSIIYAANYPTMNALLAYLTEHCCRDNPAACMPEPCVPASASRTRASTAQKSTSCAPRANGAARA